MAKERRRRRRDRKGGKKLDLEISKKISAMLNEGEEEPAEEEPAEQEPAEEAGEAEARQDEGAEPAADEPAAEARESETRQDEGAKPAEEEPSAAAADEARPARRRKGRTRPPEPPADAIEDAGASEAPAEVPAAEAADTAGEPAVVKIEDRKPRPAGRPKPPPRPRRRRGDRRAPGSPLSDLEAEAKGIEARLLKRQKLMGMAKIGVAAVFFLFFGFECDSMFTARSLHNERIEDARFLQNKINEIYTQVTELERIYERKKRKQMRFTRELVDLAVKKGPDSINRQFVTLLGEVEQRLKNMHPSTVGDIIEFHNGLTGLAEAVKEHATALDEDEWALLMKYASADKLPEVHVAIVVDPPEPKPGVDIVLERGEPVIIQEVVKHKRSRTYKVHKVGRSLPVYELAPEQLQMAKLDGYVEDGLHRAIDKYEKSEKKVREHLTTLMKSRSSLMTLIQKYATAEKVSEF